MRQQQSEFDPFLWIALAFLAGLAIAVYNASWEDFQIGKASLRPESSLLAETIRQPQTRFSVFLTELQAADDANNFDLFEQQNAGKTVDWWVLVDDVLEEDFWYRVVPIDDPELGSASAFCGPSRFNKNVPEGSWLHIRGTISSISRLGPILQNVTLLEARTNGVMWQPAPKLPTNSRR